MNSILSTFKHYAARLLGPKKSGHLRGKKLYLSGPIEHGAGNWRDEPKRILTEEFGIDLFDPSADPKQQWVPMLEKARADKNFESIKKIAVKFVRKDLGVVDRSDLIIAYLPHKVATCGTHHEIIFANESKKPTLLICPEGKEFIPIWYYGFISLEFMFGSWEELFDYLREVDAGLHKDNDRWDFVYDLI
jgi:nucleoside 2-deoxyribosyltransferase